MTIYEFGDVVVANIVFSNQEGKKPRPAIVISNSLYHANKPDVILVPLTSNLRCVEVLGEFVLSDLSTTGLSIPSRAKAFVATLDPVEIKYRIGRLSRSDILMLQAMIALLFSEETV